MNEKNLVILATLGTIILGIIASLIAWFVGGKDLQSHNKEILRQLLNFQITIAIVGFLVNLIPFVGQFIFLVIFVVSIVYAVKGFNASNKNTEFKAPSFEIVK